MQAAEFVASAKAVILFVQEKISEKRKSWKVRNRAFVKTYSLLLLLYEKLITTFGYMLVIFNSLVLHV